MTDLKKNLPLIVIISIVSILALSQVFSNNFRIKILNIFRTPLRMISGAYYVLKDVSDFKEMRMENEILKENIAYLKKQVLELQEERLENKRLRKLLGFKESTTQKIIPAMVIARDPAGLGSSIVIDKGKKHHVQKHMTVISGNGLVGRVQEVGIGIARVVLIIHQDSVVGSIVQRTRDEGAVSGTGTGLVMKYLDLYSKVKKGDKIITSGFSGVFKKGILIGKVTSVKKSTDGLYLEAIIEPEVDMGKLEEVVVVR